ncbi:unnamed protein product [Blepharisma stoltei]|uniref:Uncharacterized protein n=1 Tax=Blepharisma stoltei TaxID=1481888 RepID=A0AAU9J6X1_9CILI|nr:unnamed protein product [Blepharisma stoltei]
MTDSSNDDRASIRTVEIRREIEALKEILHNATQSPLKLICQSQSDKVSLLLEKKAVKETEQIQNLLKNCRDGPEIYLLLANCCHNFGVDVKIPETLLYISSQRLPIFLYNHPTGPIVSEQSSKAIDRFFEKSEGNIAISKYKVPKYIHFAMNDKIRVCYTAEEARKLFEECPHYYHRLQRFIPPISNYASKVRVHWVYKKPQTIYSMSNINPIEQNYIYPRQNYSRKTQSRSNKEIPYSYTSNLQSSSFSVSLPYKSIFNGGLKPHTTPMKKRSHLAGSKSQIYLNEDFLTQSYFLENHTKETDKNPFQGQNPEEDNQFEYQKFVVQYSLPGTYRVIISHQTIPELSKALSLLCFIINNFYLKKVNNLQELFTDFIRDQNNNWILLSCKGHKIKGDSKAAIKKRKSLPKVKNERIKTIPKIKLNLSTHKINLEEEGEEILEENRHPPEKTRQEDYYVDKLAKEFEDQANLLEIHPKLNFNLNQSSEENLKFYLAQRRSDSLGRIPYNMIGISPNKPDNPITNFVETKIDPPVKPARNKDRFRNLSFVGLEKAEGLKYIDIASKHIDDISKTFDKRAKAAHEGRSRITNVFLLREFMKSWGSVADKLIKESVIRLHRHPTLSMFFENRNDQEMDALYKGLTHCLKPNLEIGMRSKLKRTHQPFNITQNEFNAFIENISDTFKSSNFDDKDVNIILDRLRIFEKDIVKYQ